MQFICYPKCTTCQKARKWLEAKCIAIEERHIKENNPTTEELSAWQRKSGLPLKKFYNTSGLLYKDMKLSTKIPNMSEEEQLALLATDGMLVKLQIQVGDGIDLVGFKESDGEPTLGQ